MIGELCVVSELVELTPDLVITGDVTSDSGPDEPRGVLTELPSIIHAGIIRQCLKPLFGIKASIFAWTFEPVFDLHVSAFELRTNDKPEWIFVRMVILVYQLTISISTNNILPIDFDM